MNQYEVNRKLKQNDIITALRLAFNIDNEWTDMKWRKLKENDDIIVLRLVSNINKGDNRNNLWVTINWVSIKFILDIILKKYLSKSTSIILVTFWIIHQIIESTRPRCPISWLAYRLSLFTWKKPSNNTMLNNQLSKINR